MKLHKYITNFKNKKILITGHTGFKGTWLSGIFSLFDAKIYGISIDYPTSPSFYKMMNFKNIKSYWLDIKNYKLFKKKFNQIKPDYVFHLAAQTIVGKSYTHPLRTWHSNLNGTLNLLEILRNYKRKCNVIIITSDKCYENLEKRQGYSESDRLGGSENYSASKASCEILINSYFKSYFCKSPNIRLSSVRAGNVIGGGDWAKNRIIPDIVQSLLKKKKLLIRYPKATRPWQHVLEPLFGYIKLAICLNKDKNLSGESFNFGPSGNKNYSVYDILQLIKSKYANFSWKLDKRKKDKETMILKLQCNKVLKKIKWKTKLNFKETIFNTISWYENYKNIGCREITYKQIKSYLKKIA
jgi:CDP-glucose 4,6-dehydratase